MGERIPEIDQIVHPIITSLEVIAESRPKRVSHSGVSFAQSDPVSRNLLLKSFLVDPHPSEIVDAAVYVRDAGLNIDLCIVKLVPRWHTNRSRRNDLVKFTKARRSVPTRLQNPCVAYSRPRPVFQG